MAGFTGMDIEAVKGLSQALKTKADEINTLMTQLTTQLSNTQWVGPDATKFRDEWQSQHVQALTNVKASLENASARANTNAIEQENASA